MKPSKNLVIILIKSFLWLLFSALYAYGIFLFQILGLILADEAGHYYVGGFLAVVFAVISRLAFFRSGNYWWALTPLFLPIGLMLLGMLSKFLPPRIVLGPENTPLGLVGYICILIALISYILQLIFLIKSYPGHKNIAASPSDQNL